MPNKLLHDDPPITHHCRECGAQVEDFCAEHPAAIVDSILATDYRQAQAVTRVALASLGASSAKGGR